MVYDPPFRVGLPLSVNVLNPYGEVRDEGANDAVIPAGKPVAVSEMGAVNPPVAVTPTAMVMVSRVDMLTVWTDFVT